MACACGHTQTTRFDTVARLILNGCTNTVHTAAATDVCHCFTRIRHIHTHTHTHTHARNKRIHTHTHTHTLYSAR